MTVSASRPRGYDHMGAVLVDAGLQAGVSYSHVVAPRVRRLLLHWPRADTVGRFDAKRRRHGLAEVLRWRDPLKLERIAALAALCVDEGVDTVADAQWWLADERARAKLVHVSGIGEKTAAYLRILVGLEDLAVDRHMRSFAEGVGLRGSDRQLRQRLIAAAEDCRLSLADVDRSLFANATGSPSQTASWRVEQLRAALLAEPGTP